MGKAVSEKPPATFAPPKRWIAGLLSFLAPGAGQIYSGQPRRGIWLFALTLLSAVAARASQVMLATAPLNILLPEALAWLWHLYVMVDAVILAKRQGTTYPPSRYNRWPVYIGAIAGIWLITAGVNYAVVLNMTRNMRVPSEGMEDSIRAGDELIVNLCSYGIPNPITHKRMTPSGEPRRGEVIIFASPVDRKIITVKRVIGLPGDQVAIRQNQVFINDQLYNEPYVKPAGPGLSSGDEFGPLAVPRGSYFVLGDNRPKSADSRHWGFVRLDEIMGRAVRVYWSIDPKSSLVRWDRIGRTIS